MRSEASFIAERVAAQHCPELLRGTRHAVNSLKELARLGETLPEILERHLGALCAGAGVEVKAGEAVEIPAAAKNEKRGEPVLNSTMAFGAKEVTMVASLPCRAVFSLVDLALGGNGKDCAVPAGKLPLSAQLTFGRFEKVLAAALAEALEVPGENFIKLKRESAGPEANAPFVGCKRTILPLEVSLAGQEPWELAFVFPGSAAVALFASCGSEAKSSASPASGRTAMNANSEPLSSVPLPLTAVLVDMAMPVSILSQLKPGLVLPVAVARSVPLLAGEQVIAHGTVGAMDDRAALQLTRITATKEN